MSFSFKKNLSGKTDDELLELVLDGNNEAVVYMFYEKFSATFQYLIYNIFSYRVDVTEMVNELFLYLQQDNWRRLRTYDSSQSSLSTWISKVSYRFFKNYKATKIDYNGVITISDKWETFRGDWVQSSDAGIMMDVKNSISEIKSERDREIAEMLFFEDLPYEDVAAKFEMSVDYVYTVKNRIIKQLKKSLNIYG